MSCDFDFCSDVVIVGAGIAGCALAHALATTRPPNLRPLRIALLERSLAEPDRIVGELLQPGGIHALKSIGLEKTLEGIGAIPVHGYCVVHDKRIVKIPYPEGEEGRSFHHGRFIMTLRAAAKSASGVDVIEATARELVECPMTGRILGVVAKRQGEEDLTTFFADLTVVADGCFSKFRTSVLTPPRVPREPQLRSHFVGAILKGTRLLPADKHGTVVLVPGSGPVLLYQIEAEDTRMLVDLKPPLPKDQKAYILTNILPHLPVSLQHPVQITLENDRLRSMPNSFLPPSPQGGNATKEGVITLGDAWNMRHPLTGGGMTVAFSDVVILARFLAPLPDFTSWSTISPLLDKWFWARKPLSSTINILSVALYDLFGADGEELEVLRTGCFKYFELGGDCVAGPVSLLSGLAPSVLLLFNHFFAVAFYSIWVLFTHPRPTGTPVEGEKPVLRRPGIDEYPMLAIKSISVFWTACIVFGPLLWTEVRWW